MSVVRGTFRLSFLVVAVMLVYAPVSAHFSAIEGSESAREMYRKLWITLRCGERFLDKDMTQFTNEYGLIDIGRAGCSSSSFLATFDEIRDALAKTNPPDPSPEYRRIFSIWVIDGLVNALLGFVVVNLAGLGVLTL